MALKLNQLKPEKRKTWNKEYYTKKAEETKKEELKEILNLDLDETKKHNKKSLVSLLYLCFYPRTIFYIKK